MGMRVYMKLVMIMELRVVNFATSRNRVQCSHIATHQLLTYTDEVNILG